MGDLIRGKIHNKARKLQVLDFSGLQYERKITPTDIDFALEFMGKMFIFGEYKLEGYEMPYGQKLYFENICNAIQPIPAIVFLAWHQTPVNLEIDAANCQVRSYYASGRWLFPSHPVTVKQFIDDWRLHPEQINPIELEKALTIIRNAENDSIHRVLDILRCSYTNPNQKRQIWDALTAQEKNIFFNLRSSAS